MSDNQDALRLADCLGQAWTLQSDQTKAAAHIRRLVAENEALKAELVEQARLNGTGSEREARLMALNAELVEALRGWMNQPEDAATYDACMARAEAALARVQGESK